jgi:hypothetical protein
MFLHHLGAERLSNPLPDLYPNNLPPALNQECPKWAPPHWMTPINKNTLTTGARNTVDNAPAIRNQNLHQEALMAHGHGHKPGQPSIKELVRDSTYNKKCLPVFYGDQFDCFTAKELIQEISLTLPAGMAKGKAEH